jgi:hypothetical protein
MVAAFNCGSFSFFFVARSHHHLIIDSESSKLGLVSSLSYPDPGVSPKKYLRFVAHHSEVNCFIFVALIAFKSHCTLQLIVTF